MHWFWRLTIAVAAGCVFGAFAGSGWATIEAYGILLDVLPLHPQAAQYALAVVFLLAAPIIVGLATFGLVTHWTRTPAWRETRCRKCGYILRGITEPRCPECGERI